MFAAWGGRLSLNANMKPPAFQFYPDDFTAGVSTMTQTEVGAYILLLCHQWSVGKISSEAERMEIVAKGKVSDHVLSKFPNGKNKRLEIERKKQQLFRESRAKNGKLGGRPCKASDNLVVLKTEARKSSPSPSPSPSPSVDTITHTHTAEIPSLTEIKAFASVNGVKPESAQSFFDHHEGNQLWINQHGKAINWRHKLTVWATTDRSKPKQTNGKHLPESKQLQEVINVPSL